MRETKYRAWNPVSKVMHYGKDVSITQSRYGVVESLVMYQAEDVDQVLMQYAGRKDKNEKDGYDGDLASLGDALYLITWDNEYACWQMKRVRGSHALGMPSIPLHNLSKSEIIGNVKENPELIGSRSE